MPDYIIHALDEAGLIDGNNKRRAYQRSDYIGREKKREVRQKNLNQTL